MAKKKSPAELKEEGAALNTLITMARKRDHNFAMLIGKEGLFLEADPKKPADLMRRKAKAAGGGSKGAQGVMRVNGKVVEFICDADDPPRTLTQMAKVHFRERGQKVKIMILTASGAAMGDDDDDEEETGDDRQEVVALEPEAEEVERSPAEEEADVEEEAVPEPQDEAPPEPSDDPEADLRAQLMAEFEELRPRVAAAVESAAKGIGKKATKLAETFEADIETAAQKAAKVLTLLRSTLDKAGVEASEAPAAPDGASPPPGSESSRAVPSDGEASGGAEEGDGLLGDIGQGLSSALGSLGLPTSMGEAVDSVQRTLGLSELPATPDEAMASLGGVFEGVMESLSHTYDEITGNPRAAERDAIAAQQERLAAAYTALASDPAAAARVAEELTRLTTMLQTAEQIAALDEDSPEAAAAAREAMAGFDAELGPGTPVTPELLAQLEAERAAAQTRVDEARAALEAAEAMPEEAEGRDAAIASARAELDIAQPQLEAAESKQRAARGKQELTEAITVGPLSPDAPRPFSDESAAQFVEAYARRPELADFATETAARSENPDAIAAGMGMLCDHIDNGFADGEGNLPPEDFDGEAYARNLVTGANAEGGDYMQDAEAYIQSGGHLQDEPIPLAMRSPRPPAGASDDEIAAWEREDLNLRSRERTHFIADAVMSPDGTIDTQSDEAQQAMGHLRFNPDVIDEPTSEVNGRVADMYELLSDDDNRQRAEGILQGVDTPRGTGAALVGRSANLNQSTGAPTAEDARQSVMMSMMTPVHQGDVGSCFATAGVRRMSELNPLDTMEQYANIAETGQYRPANGMDAIPAVTSFNESEDPLIRSFEYSAATVVADMDGNWRNELMDDAFVSAMDGLMGPVGSGTDAESAAGADNWQVDEAIIRGVVERSFIVEYNAEAQSAEQARDGHSKHGGYFLVQVEPSRVVINDKAQFATALTERVLTALNLAEDDPRREEISNTINSDAYLDAMANANGRAPWNLGGGGHAVEADEVLFGEEREHVNIVDEADPTVAQSQGQRAEDVVENLLEQFSGTDEEMIAIRTAGIHSFNGLPDHPSLEPLLEGGNVEENMEEHLLAPGREIAATDLPEHHLETMLTDFRSRMSQFDRSAPADRQALLDRAQSANVITGEMTPGELRDALLNAYSDYLDKVAADIAQSWMDNRVAGGTATTEAQRDARAAQNRARYVGYMNDWLTNSSASVTPVPTFTVADSNWGDAEGRVEFVVAPDPVSGEPRVYRKEMPSGEMRLAGDRWEDAQWMEIAVDD